MQKEFAQANMYNSAFLQIYFYFILIKHNNILLAFRIHTNFVQDQATRFKKKEGQKQGSNNCGHTEKKLFPLEKPLKILDKTRF